MSVHRAAGVAASAILILIPGCGDATVPMTETTPVEATVSESPSGSSSPEETGGGEGTPTSTQTESPESTQTGQPTGGPDDDTLPPESSLP